MTNEELQEWLINNLQSLQKSDLVIINLIKLIRLHNKTCKIIFLNGEIQGLEF